MRKILSFLCVAIWLLPIGNILAADESTLSASDSGYNRQHLPLGKHVRIIQFTNGSGGGYWQYGTLEHSVADSAVLCADPCEGDGQGRVVIPLYSMDRMQVHSGDRGHALTGLLIGGVLGAAGGAIALGIGASTGFGFGEEAASDNIVGPVILGGIVGFGVVGGLGAIIGSLIKTDKWEEVPLDPVQIGLIPQPGGRQAFGLTVRF